MPKKRGHNVSSVSLGSVVSNGNAETCSISEDSPLKRRTRSSSLKVNGLKISSGQEALNKCSNADQSSDLDSNNASSPQQRQSMLQKTLYTSPRKSKSPHACASKCYNGDLNGQDTKLDLESPNLQGRRVEDICCQNMKWDPKGIANAIDLADRFLPKLQALNCKPMVVTFRPYSKDQILRVLQERMSKMLGAFDPQALELCSRLHLEICGRP